MFNARSDNVFFLFFFEAYDFIVKYLVVMIYIIFPNAFIFFVLENSQFSVSSIQSQGVVYGKDMSMLLLANAMCGCHLL